MSYAKTVNNILVITKQYHHHHHHHQKAKCSLYNPLSIGSKIVFTVKLPKYCIISYGHMVGEIYDTVPSSQRYIHLYTCKISRSLYTSA